MRTQEEKVKLLSSYLYLLDPKDTCCYENEATDEYNDIANMILSMEDNGKYHVRVNNIQNVFIKQFDSGLNINTLYKISLYLGVINGEFDKIQ